MVYGTEDNLGVEIGDWVTYNIVRRGLPRVWLPSMEDATWVTANVTQLQDGTVTICETIMGITEIIRERDYHWDISSALCHRYIIPKELKAGDIIGKILMPIYNQSTNSNQLIEADVVINATLRRSYGGVERDINQLRLSWIQGEYIPPDVYHINYSMEICWDKNTGFMLEKKVQAYFVDEEFAEYYKTHPPSTFELHIYDTNLFKIQKQKSPVFNLIPTMISSLLAGICVIVVILHRKKGGQE